MTLRTGGCGGHCHDSPSDERPTEDRGLNFVEAAHPRAAVGGEDHCVGEAGHGTCSRYAHTSPHGHSFLPAGTDFIQASQVKKFLFTPIK
jgi:hypothetical protein